MPESSPSPPSLARSQQRASDATVIAAAAPSTALSNHSQSGGAARSASRATNGDDESLSSRLYNASVLPVTNAANSSIFAGDPFPHAAPGDADAKAPPAPHTDDTTTTPAHLTVPSAHPALVAKTSHTHMILAGLCSGVIVAGLFNPWDRALYLSVLHARPFLHRANFAHPYQGFLQVVVHRTLSGGLYFPLFDMAQPHTKAVIASWADARAKKGHSARTAAEQSALLHFACGNFAGAVSGVFLNGLTAVKYASWDAHTGFFATARDMYRAGGYRPFTKGIGATVVRDTIFGGVFALTKFQLARTFKPYARVDAPMAGVSFTTAAALLPEKQPDDAQHADTTTTASSQSTPAAAPIPAVSHSPEPSHPAHRLQFSAGTMDFTAALLAGLTATAVSAPFNYARNIKYGWPSDSKPPSSWRILRDLWTESRRAPSLAMHLQDRLRLGWGTARVAVGMSTGQYLYELTKNQLDQHAPLAKLHKFQPA